MSAPIVTDRHRELAVAAVLIELTDTDRSCDKLRARVALALATIEQEARARVIEECAKIARDGSDIEFEIRALGRAGQEGK